MTEIDTAANPDENLAQQDEAANTANAAKDAGIKADAKTVETKADAKVDTKAGDEKPAEDWRVKFAGGDEKELKRLARFASEADVFKAYRELEKKKSSGELVSKLSKDSTPEELAAWRKDNGIPETADKYELKFDNGLVIGEQDKPLIDEFVTKMHMENASPAQVKAAVASYYEILGKQQQAMAEQDSEYADQNIELLREEWGGDYKKNKNAVDGFINNFLPDDLRSAFINARMPDGKLLGANADIIKAFASIAYEINPAATVMPSSQNNPGAAINDEISSIEKLVGDRSSAYWRGPESDKMQSRYSELLSAREKIAARS